LGDPPLAVARDRPPPLSSGISDSPIRHPVRARRQSFSVTPWLRRIPAQCPLLSQFMTGATGMGDGGPRPHALSPKQIPPAEIERRLHRGPDDGVEAGGISSPGANPDAADLGRARAFHWRVHPPSFHPPPAIHEKSAGAFRTPPTLFSRLGIGPLSLMLIHSTFRLVIATQAGLGEARRDPCPATTHHRRGAG